MLPTNWKVFLNNIDISTKVADISNISAELDLNDPIIFNTSEARLLISYPLPKDLLFRGLIHIRAEDNLIYAGNIISIDKNPKRRRADVVVSDISQEMRNKPLEDFGLPKRVKVSSVDDTDSGEYPFGDALSPVSDKSLKDPHSGEQPYGDNTRLTIKDSILSEGALDPKNISYDERVLRSEGEGLEYNPSVTLKSPYRHKTPEFIIKEILSYYGVNSNSVEIESVLLDNPYFSSNGRVGYDLENELEDTNPLAEGVETNIFWTGRVTGFLADGDKVYFLYSSRVDNPKTRARIIVYDKLKDSYEILFTRTESHAEYWRILKEDNILFILGTTKSSPLVSRPTLGAYDPTEADPGTFIERLNIADTSNISKSVLVASDTTYKAVLGMYYQMGFPVDGRNDNIRRGKQPDTRNGFLIHGDYLYYRYASNASCGIARIHKDGASSPEVFVRITRDNYLNHLTFDFTIKDNYLYCGSCFQRESNSTRTIFRKEIT